MARTRQTARKSTYNSRKPSPEPRIEDYYKRFIGGKLGFFRNHTGTMPLSFSQHTSLQSNPTDVDTDQKRHDIDITPNANQQQNPTSVNMSTNNKTNNSSNNVDPSLSNPWPLCHKGIWQFAFPDWIFNKELDFIQHYYEMMEAKEDYSKHTGYKDTQFYDSWWEKEPHGKQGDYGCKNQFEWIDNAIEMLKHETTLMFLPFG